MTAPRCRGGKASRCHGDSPVEDLGAAVEDLGLGVVVGSDQLVGERLQSGDLLLLEREKESAARYRRTQWEAWLFLGFIFAVLRFIIE